MKITTVSELQEVFRKAGFCLATISNNGEVDLHLVDHEYYGGRATDVYTLQRSIDFDGDILSEVISLYIGNVGRWWQGVFPQNTIEEVISKYDERERSINRVTVRLARP
jgi:hypothetical protein